MNGVEAAKRRLRSEFRAKVAMLPSEVSEQSDRAIQNRVLSLPEFLVADSIFCYVGVQGEIATTTLIDVALSARKRVAVPMVGANRLMEARVIADLHSLRKGAFGLLEPDASMPVLHPCEIDLSLVPCVSCDRMGNRLGQGGGYYDRYLSMCQSLAVALCRDVLISAELPTEEHDVPMDIVGTESALYRRIV